MKRILYIMILLLLLSGCSKTYTIHVDVYSDPDIQYFYADEVVIPNENMITVTLEKGYGDGMLIVKPLNENGGNVEEMYISHGMPVKVFVKRGEEYRIGVLNKSEYKSLKCMETFDITITGVKDMYIE